MRLARVRKDSIRNFRTRDEVQIGWDRFEIRFARRWTELKPVRTRMERAWDEVVTGCDEVG